MVRALHWIEETLRCLTYYKRTKNSMWEFQAYLRQNWALWPLLPSLRSCSVPDLFDLVGHGVSLKSVEATTPTFGGGGSLPRFGTEYLGSQRKVKWYNPAVVNCFQDFLDFKSKRLRRNLSLERFCIKDCFLHRVIFHLHRRYGSDAAACIGTDWTDTVRAIHARFTCRWMPTSPCEHAHQNTLICSVEGTTCDKMVSGWGQKMSKVTSTIPL